MTTETCLRLSTEQPRRTLGRWAGAVVLMVGIHVSGAAIGMMQWNGPVDMPAPLPPAIMIDLMPMAVTPPPPPPTVAPEVTEIAPEPEPEIVPPDLAEMLPVEPEIDLPPLVELDELLPPPPDVVAAVEVPVKKKKEEKKAEKKREKKKEEKKVEKKKEEKVEQKVVAKTVGDLQTKEFKTAGEVATKTTIEVPKASQSAAVPTGPTAADLAAIASARASWEGQVIAHLQKFKKYPRVAKRRNQTGAPTVQFAIDRAGNVQKVMLVSSSGHESLDEEALAAIRRAEPLPAVPPEIEGAIIVRDVPINFTLTD